MTDSSQAASASALTQILSHFSNTNHQQQRTLLSTSSPLPSPTASPPRSTSSSTLRISARKMPSGRKEVSLNGGATFEDVELSAAELESPSTSSRRQQSFSSTARSGKTRSDHDAFQEHSVVNWWFYAAFFYLGFCMLASFNTILATGLFIRYAYSDGWYSAVNWMTSVPNVILVPFVGYLSQRVSYTVRIAGLFGMQFFCCIGLLFFPEIRFGGNFTASIALYLIAVSISSAGLSITQGSLYSLSAKCGNSLYIQAVSTGTASSGFVLPLFFYLIEDFALDFENPRQRLAYNFVIWGTTMVCLLGAVYVYYWLRRNVDIDWQPKLDRPTGVGSTSSYKVYADILRVNWKFALVCFGAMFSNFFVFPTFMFEIDSGIDHYPFGLITLQIFGLCDLSSRLTKDFLRPRILEAAFSRETIHWTLLARIVIVWPPVLFVFFAQRGYVSSTEAKGTAYDVMLTLVYAFCAFTLGYMINSSIAFGSDALIAEKVLEGERREIEESRRKSMSLQRVPTTPDCEEPDSGTSSPVPYNEEPMPLIDVGEESSDADTVSGSAEFSSPNGSRASRAAYTPNREERISNIQEKAGLVMTYALVCGIFFGTLCSFVVDVVTHPGEE